MCSCSWARKQPGGCAGAAAQVRERAPVGGDRGGLAGEHFVEHFGVGFLVDFAAGGRRRAAGLGDRDRGRPPPPPQAVRPQRKAEAGDENPEGAKRRAAPHDSVRGHEEDDKPMSSTARRGAGGAGRGGARLPPLPAAGRVARGLRGRPAAPLPGRGVLGAAARRLRRPGGAGRDRRPRARRRTAPTGPAACSPAIAPASGSTRRCTAPASPTSAESERRGDGLRLGDAYVTAVVRCAPPANKPTPQERDNCLPYLERELELLERGRVIVALGAFAWDGVAACRPRARGRGPAAEAALRPRRRGGPRPLGAARLLPPQPAEHLHRQADRADDRRRLRPRPGAGRATEPRLVPSVEGRSPPRMTDDRGSNARRRRSRRPAATCCCCARAPAPTSGSSSPTRTTGACCAAFDGEHTLERLYEEFGAEEVDDADRPAAGARAGRGRRRRRPRQPGGAGALRPPAALLQRHRPRRRADPVGVPAAAARGEGRGARSRRARRLGGALRWPASGSARCGWSTATGSRSATSTARSSTPRPTSARPRSRSRRSGCAPSTRRCG